LGVTPKDPGFKKISIRPQLGNLKYVKGVIPTAAGEITIEATPQKLLFKTPSPAEVFFKGRLRLFPAGTHEF
jgi:hypothetical protein